MTLWGRAVHLLSFECQYIDMSCQCTDSCYTTCLFVVPSSNAFITGRYTRCLSDKLFVSRSLYFATHVGSRLWVTLM